MQPSNSPPDLNRLRQAWTQFVSGGRISAGADPLVAISWQRCAPLLNPTTSPRWAYLRDDIFQLAQSQHASLRSIARPIMEDIHQFIEGAGVMLLLTDSTNCVLEMLGDRSIIDYMSHLGMRQGAFLDESRLGTNAFASALIEGCPAQIVGAEHFLRCFHSVGCAAAPIYNIDGRPVGTIGLLARVEQYDRHSFGTAVATARSIENQIQANMLVREAHKYSTGLNATMEAISEGVLAWTDDGMIMYLNRQAGQLLGLSPTGAVGRLLAEYLTLPERLAKAVVQGEELSDVETHFVVNGTQRDCLVSLRTICSLEGEITAYIATLRPLDQIRQLVTRQVGAQARLTLNDLPGNSPAIQRIRKQALGAADARACVLILGEGGTGKNVLARATHNSSRRADKPFLAIHCRAIPRELALSEFLGFEAGAYGTASEGRPSKFELASGGTLFLEEVESLPLETQSALLRVIEAGDVIRLGGTRVISVDVRVITSSTAHLESCVADGTFRADLLFRLRSFVIKLLPLRDRPEDIPAVLDRTLEKLSAQVGHPLTLTMSARSALCEYPWPGNVRELESVMERAVLLSNDAPIGLEQLPEAVRQRHLLIPGTLMTEPVRSLNEAEKLAILSAGRATHGNLSRAASILGIGRTTLWRKMKELGLSSEDFSALDWN